MATPAQRAAVPELIASDLVVGVIRTRWNAAIVDRLVAGASRAIEAVGASRVDVTVPGAFELPFAARRLIAEGTVDAVVAVGVVVRGETTHYELVSENCARGIMDVQLATGIPIGFGVLAVENEAQALARSESEGGHNVGEEATYAAVELAVLDLNSASG